MLADVIVRYGYALIFVGVAVEGDATLVTATFLAHRGYLKLDLVMLVAATATVAINQAYFWLGRRYGQHRVNASRQRQRFKRVLDWIEHYGMPLVVGSRFAYGFRIAIPLACGATGMPPLRFALGDVAGSIVWVGVVGLAGYAIGHVLEHLFDDLRRHEWWIAIALFAAGMIVLAWHGRDSSPARLLKARLRSGEGARQ
jgi:membrane protein DedA with SNARE-associated domain